MNSVIKFAMAASALALVACSGKGSADATLDGQEFFKDDSGMRSGVCKQMRRRRRWR